MGQKAPSQPDMVIGSKQAGAQILIFIDVGGHA